MSKDEMKKYRDELGQFFYPFLGNVQLGNISAADNTKELVDAFIEYQKDGFFNFKRSHLL